MAVISIGSTEAFDKLIAESTKPVLVDFWAEWCGPCKILSPRVDEAAEEMDDVTVAKVNVDDEETLAARYKVMQIPTLLLFKNGEVANKSIGAITKDQIIAFARG
ncbi:MAG: thioredoxin [Lachnospiraceae bacterium]|nr:thioredoxin [Lachnospiraceae bacterium]